MPLPAETSEPNEPKRIKPLDVMVVDHWLIFDCPGCDQTIKLDRKDSIFEIECPSCRRGFEPLLDRDVKLPPRKGPARKRARRRGPRGLAEGEDEAEASMPEKRPSSGRPTAASLPTEGVVKLALIPNSVEDKAKRIPTVPSTLPVRSAIELERRRVESLDSKEKLQPDESELNAVIEEQSGGKYKRIRVRTRRKRLTEKQRTTRLYLYGGIAALLVTGLSIWGASHFYKDDVTPDDDNTLAESSFRDSDPIGPRLEHYTNLIQALKEADTVDKLLPLIRYPKRLEETLRAYYPGGVVTPPVIRRPPKPVLGLGLAPLPKNFSRYELSLPTKEIPIYLENTTTHGERLDWESYAGLGDLPWKAFVEQKVTRTSRMRLYASREDYFEAPFSPERHNCIRIEDPAREYTLYGYYERNDPKMKNLMEFMYKSEANAASRTIIPGQAPNPDAITEAVPITLDIRFPNTPTNGVQVEIVEFSNTTWLKP